MLILWGIQMNKQEFTDFLKNIDLSKKDFAELSNISYNTVNNWNDENRPVPPWVKSWLDNYVKAKNYNDMRHMVLNTENLYPIIMEKILKETDHRYEEQAYYIYRDIKDIEQTIYMIKIASCINADAGHLKGCNKEKIKKLYDYLEMKGFKPTKEDESMIINFMNNKDLNL